MKRVRGLEREDSAAVRKEEILNQTTSEYEAIVAIAKEARRLNAVPGVFLEKDESAIPKAVENFVGGSVEYVVEGGERRECAEESGRGKAGGRSRARAGRKPARKAAKKSSRKK